MPSRPCPQVACLSHQDPESPGPCSNRFDAPAVGEAPLAASAEPATRTGGTQIRARRHGRPTRNRPAECDPPHRGPRVRSIDAKKTGHGPRGGQSHAAAAASHPQPSRKVWHIGYLSAGPRTQDGAPPRAFREALRELGYVESQNVTYSGRWAEGKVALLRGLADELIAANVDAVLAFGGGPTAQALKLATSTVPIVFAGAGDPVGVGLVPSLSRPGANITGISAQATELSAKRLELLKEMVPAATRIAVLWNASDPAMTLRYGEIERAAPVLRVGSSRSACASRTISPRPSWR